MMKKIVGEIMKRKLLLAGVAVVVALIGLSSMSQMSYSEDKKADAAQAADADAWQTRCDKVNEKGEKDENGKNKQCEIFQKLVMQDTGQRVMEFAIGYPAKDQKDKNKDKKARGVLILPLGILLPPGGQIRVDDQQPFSFQIRYCTQGGCVAYLDMNDKVLDIFRKGTKAEILMGTLQGKTLGVPMSLKGFTKALKDLG